MEHGNLMVLVQPAELLIIDGARYRYHAGCESPATLIGIVKGLVGVFKPSPFTQAFYLEHLRMLNELFQYARKAGMVNLEADLEEPKKSEVFKKYSKFLGNHHALNFVCDTLRTSLGGVGSFELDQMMELDMELHLDRRRACRRANDHGGCAARPRYCGRCTWLGGHYGCAGKPPGGDRT